MPEENRFVDNQDGTVTDTKTSLMWMREDGWQKEGKWYTWDEAYELPIIINGIKFASYQDWRLPLQDEIESLYHPDATNQDKYGKEIHLWPIFPSGSQATVWLRSDAGQDGTIFDFKNGEARPLYKSKSGRMSVRAVRGEMLK